MLSYKNENGKVKELAAGGVDGRPAHRIGLPAHGGLQYACAQRQSGGGDLQGKHDDGRERPGIAGMAGPKAGLPQHRTARQAEGGQER